MVGGWLLVSRSGRFHKRERLMAGIASGMLLYILLGNALAHWLPVYAAFASAAVLILAAGGWASRKSKFRWHDLFSLEIGLQVLALLLIFGVFELIMRGLGLGMITPIFLWSPRWRPGIFRRIIRSIRIYSCPIIMRWICLPQAWSGSGDFFHGARGILAGRL